MITQSELKKTGQLRPRNHGKKFTDHRLAFLYVEGAIPCKVWHANKVLDDNSWKNLLPHRKNGRPE